LLPGAQIVVLRVPAIVCAAHRGNFAVVTHTPAHPCLAQLEATYRRLAAVRLSRLLHDRLLDQRQAKRTPYLDSTSVRAGAEIRNVAMVGRIDMERDRASSAHYLREGRRRFQKARDVLVGCYSEPESK
jgi:hypothetical protein